MVPCSRPTYVSLHHDRWVTQLDHKSLQATNSEEIQSGLQQLYYYYLKSERTLAHCFSCMLAGCSLDERRRRRFRPKCQSTHNNELAASQSPSQSSSSSSATSSSGEQKGSGCCSYANLFARFIRRAAWILCRSLRILSYLSALSWCWCC